MKDMILGFVTDYTFDKVQAWADSIDAVGFQGQKVMVVFDGPDSLVDELMRRNFATVTFNKVPGGYRYSPDGHRTNIVVDRFYFMWSILSKLSDLDEYRYCITTDVRDVVFQRNPVEYLEKVLHPQGVESGLKLVVGSECLEYQHEDWGRENLDRSFPMFYEYYKNKTIYNAGTIAGDIRFLKDFAAAVYLASINNPVHNPDQAALNLLLGLEPYKSATHFAQVSDGWCVQAGTVADPRKIEGFRPHFKEPAAVAGIYLDKATGLVYNHNNEPFYLVHQYDRVPEWKSIIEGNE
jgi:hypothetical protein